MRSEDKRFGIAEAELTWFFVDRVSALGARGAGFEPSASVAWDQARIDDLHERRVRIGGLVGTRRWDVERKDYEETVAEKERRIGDRVRLLSAGSVVIAKARWESYGGDATIAALAFAYRHEPGSYLGIAVRQFDTSELELVRGGRECGYCFKSGCRHCGDPRARPRKAMLGDHVVTMPGRPQERQTALDVFKHYATSARRRLVAYRDDARRSWLGVVRAYAETRGG